MPDPTMPAVPGPPPGYRVRSMEERDYPAIAEICATVYATERPYTTEELATHHRLFPDGQFVAEHEATGAVAGCHFSLILNLAHFHVDDSWDVLTAQGLFTDHDPEGHTLYGADLMVHPRHQHHGLAKRLTDATRDLVRRRRLWRMAGGSRMPGYAAHVAALTASQYIDAVRVGRLVDPVLTAHLHDGWQVVSPIRAYLPHDVESAGWAAVIQWINPECPPPAEFDLSRLPRKE